MAGIELMRRAISTCLSDPNFSAVAARLNGSSLRQAIAQQLGLSNLEVVVISASGLGDEQPFRAAEVIWQPAEGGEFVRQTIRWRLPLWTPASRAEPSSHVAAD